MDRASQECIRRENFTRYHLIQYIEGFGVTEGGLSNFMGVWLHYGCVCIILRYYTAINIVHCIIV